MKNYINSKKLSESLKLKNLLEEWLCVQYGKDAFLFLDGYTDFIWIHNYEKDGYSDKPREGVPFTKNGLKNAIIKQFLPFAELTLNKQIDTNVISLFIEQFYEAGITIGKLRRSNKFYIAIAPIRGDCGILQDIVTWEETLREKAQRKQLRLKALAKLTPAEQAAILN